ncbi:MAG: zinc ribbon domain-containing protein [Agathobacter sp.]|nr:zinc ribbon domain-containing protein [Agathobacter sp.]
MSKCKMCKVDILDKTDKCPLCNHVLEWDGIEKEDLYPNARVKRKKYQFLENVFLFASIVLWIILFIIDYTTDPEFLWSFTVSLVIIYANVLLRLTILGKSSYMAKLIWTILIGLAFLIEADFLTGYHGWGVNFAMPTAILLWDIALLLLMLFINRRNWQSYIIDQMTALLACGVMLVLMFLDIITFPYYALGVQVFTLLMFVGTIILGDRKAREELMRRFHW